MALKIKTNLVVEDILDEKGNKIGEIKFNPNDETIMKKMSDIIVDLTDKLNKQKEIGEIREIKENLNTLEEFESEKENIEKIVKTCDLQYEAVKNAIDNLADIFGKETMNVITGGAVSIDNLYPLIDFLLPYIKESRSKMVGKYTNGNSTVFE